MGFRRPYPRLIRASEPHKARLLYKGEDNPRLWYIGTVIQYLIKTDSMQPERKRERKTPLLDSRGVSFLFLILLILRITIFLCRYSCSQKYLHHITMYSFANLIDLAYTAVVFPLFLCSRNIQSQLRVVRVEDTGKVWKGKRKEGEKKERKGGEEGAA